MAPKTRGNPVYKKIEKETPLEWEEKETSVVSRKMKSASSSKQKIVRGRKKCQHVEIEEIRQDSFLHSKGPRRKGKEKKKTPVAAERFSSEEAYEKYELLKPNALLPERRFPKKYPTIPESILATITNLGCEIFCHNRERAIVPMVKNFYANVNQDSDYHTMVRGEVVDCSPRAINQLFMLETFKHVAFNEMIGAPSDMQLDSALKTVS